VKRALVVDDKEENTEYLSALLRGHGYEVVSARHGAEALTLARQRHPDIVISDLLMPVMDGYTLLRHWKVDEQLTHIPFVVYTATYTEREDETLALELGADAFILKPLEPEVLMSRIEEVELRPSAPISAPPGGPDSLLREYNQTLIRKLEQKTILLEEANRALKADLAAREVAEAALRESEASLRMLTEAMPQLVWVADVNDGNVFANRRWSEYTGQTEAQTRGQGWQAAFHPDDRDRVREVWQAAAQAGEPYSVEARIQKADGSSAACLVRGIPLRTEAGRVTRWVGTCTDVQELKDAEERLRRAEEQLQTAQKLEAIGRLAGGIAHDFNNVLSVILSYSEFLLQDAPEGGTFRDDLKELKRAGERAAALTRQLLSYSRRSPAQPDVVVPGQLLLDMQPLLLRLLGEDIDLVLSADPPFGRVLADGAQLEQVIMNLIVNARDAMPRGGRLGVEIANLMLSEGELGAHADAAPGAYVRLSVTDDGTGMDATTKAHIFEPFYTTKERGHGTGLGLAIVHGIVRQCGGHITVTSELGRGTRFDILLPRTHRMESEIPAAMTQIGDLRGSETVLLVEDDDQVRHAVRTLLQRSGYEVIDARSAGEALILSEKLDREVHLLVSDVVMPHMGGPELAERLKQSRPHMCVLYMTGHGENARPYCESLDCAVFEKPVVPEPFLRGIREVLANARTQREA